MTIQVGEKVPSATLKYLSPEGPKEITTDELFRGKKVALFAVPGAFTPTCSNRQCPAYDLVYDDTNRDNDTLARNRSAVLRSLIEQLAKHKLFLARASDQPPAPLPF